MFLILFCVLYQEKWDSNLKSEGDNNEFLKRKYFILLLYI